MNGSDPVGSDERLRERVRELEQELAELRDAVARERNTSAAARSVIETAEDAVFVKDSARRYTLVNPAMCRMLGHPVDELVGKTPEEIFDAEDAAIVSAVDARVLRGAVANEVRTVKARGEERVFHTVQTPVRDATGEVLAICGIVRDITDQQRAEEEATASKELMRQVGESVLEGIIVYDRELRYRFINPFMEAITGVAADQLVGRYPAEVFPFLVDAGIVARLERALVGETLEPLDIYLGPEASVPWVSDLTSTLRDPAGEVAGVITTVRDISDRKRAERSLREAELLLRTAVAAAPIILFTTDDTGVVTHVLGAGLAPLGLEPEQVVGTPLVEWPRGTDVPERGPAVRRALGGEAAEYSAVLGDIAWDVALKPIFGEHGAVEGIVGTGVDVTARRRQEAERLALERRVLRAQKLESLGVMASGIAHDFNNILVSILGNTSLALEELTPESPVRKQLEEIEHGAERAAEFANQLLAYTGRGKQQLSSIDLSALVREMCHMLRVSASRRISLDLDLADGLPPVTGDLTQIRQVLLNLVTNAAEAVEERTGVVKLTTETVSHDGGAFTAGDAPLADPARELPAGRYVVVRVVDDGCGMDEETQAKIFEPFFTTKFTGRGLGLAAVQGIVRGHQGAITVRSEPSRGTTFEIWLPADTEPAAGARGSMVPASAVGAREAQGTVLLVDDDRTVLAVVGRMLGKLGFEVVTAPDGAEALALVRAAPGRFVCVVLDLTMPRLGGEECFAELRRIDAALPIVICSGYHVDDIAQRFAGQPRTAFMQKPYRIAALRLKLSEVLG